MKKLSLKNLKVVKISDKEKTSILGGAMTASCNGSCAMSCNQTSAWPIDCASKYIDCSPR
jgi:hypothetical protein